MIDLRAFENIPLRGGFTIVRMEHTADRCSMLWARSNSADANCRKQV